MSPAFMTFLGLNLLKSQPPNGRDMNAAKAKIPIRKPICRGLPPRCSKKRERRSCRVIAEYDIKIRSWIFRIPGSNFFLLIE
jgi:hypothetical protein